MSSEPPGPAQALEDSAPLSGLLYPAFEYATEKASSYIEVEQLRPDPNAYAMLVRWHVARQLKLAGQEVEFDCDEMALLGCRSPSGATAIGLGRLIFRANCPRQATRSRRRSFTLSRPLCSLIVRARSNSAAGTM